MWACLGGHAAVVSKLLSLGSNIGAKDAEQRLGLHWAAEKGHADAVGVLVKDMLQANMDIQAQVRLNARVSHFLPWHLADTPQGAMRSDGHAVRQMLGASP